MAPIVFDGERKIFFSFCIQSICHVHDLALLHIHPIVYLDNVSKLLPNIHLQYYHVHFKPFHYF